MPKQLHDRSAGLIRKMAATADWGKGGEFVFDPIKGERKIVGTPHLSNTKNIAQGQVKKTAGDASVSVVDGATAPSGSKQNKRG